MNAIKIERLSFFYDKKEAPILDNLNIEIPQGAVTAILGPNGSGKTTLLSILLGLLVPDSGDIDFFPKSDNQRTRKNTKQMIGMVSQNEVIPFDLNVIEYVLLGRAPYLQLFKLPNSNDMRIAKNAMRTAGIEHMEYRIVPSLSSGERQLVSIARVLTQIPDILLFDEPTSHLDLPNSRKILSLMRTIAREEKRTVIFTTHDPNAASVIGDNMILLGRKGLVASGKPRNIFTEENLFATYGEQLEVIQTHRGPIIMAI